MYWFLVTGASQKFSTEKLPVLPKTLKKSMEIYDISGNKSMNVQNRSFGGVLEKRCNLGKNV